MARDEEQLHPNPSFPHVHCSLFPQLHTNLTCWTVLAGASTFIFFTGANNCNLTFSSVTFWLLEWFSIWTLWTVLSLATCSKHYSTLLMGRWSIGKRSAKKGKEWRRLNKNTSNQSKKGRHISKIQNPICIRKLVFFLFSKYGLLLLIFILCVGYLKKLTNNLIKWLREIWFGGIQWYLVGFTVRFDSV